MISSKALHHLATRPSALMRFQATGELPQGKKPKGPLIDLLKKISPRDLAAMTGVTVNEKLGYSGSRQFHTASQALKWVAPSDEVFTSWPADSWRNKRLTASLYIEDLLEQCANYPEGLENKYPQLKRPTPRPNNDSAT